MSEYQNIKELEAELRIAFELDDKIKSVKGTNPIQKIINAYAVKASLYDNPEKLEKMLREIKGTYKQYLKNANITGRTLGKKSIKKFLEESEIRDLTQRQLRLINQASASQVERRLDLAFTELEKEALIFKQDLKLFKKNARLAAFTKKEQLSQLVMAGKDKDGIAQGLSKRVKSVTSAAVRRERSASKIDEYLKVAKPNEQWVWITISVKPCPDCQARAGKILPYNRWLNMGIPGMGRTICGRACACDLAPVSIADEKHPTVREFTFNTKDLVLTTASEQRVLEAKKNQFKFLKKKLIPSKGPLPRKIEKGPKLPKPKIVTKPKIRKLPPRAIEPQIPLIKPIETALPPKNIIVDEMITHLKGMDQWEATHLSPGAMSAIYQNVKGISIERFSIASDKIQDAIKTVRRKIGHGVLGKVPKSIIKKRLAGKEWVKILTENQKDALDNWAGSGYIDIRKSQKIGKKSTLGDLIEESLKKAKPHKGIVYRGLNRLSEKDFNKIINSYTIELKALSSATDDLEQAYKFAMTKPDEGKGLIFKILNNKTGIDITPVTGKIEHEILLRKGVRYQIVSRKMEEISLFGGKLKKSIQIIELREL